MPPLRIVLLGNFGGSNCKDWAKERALRFRFADAALGPASLKSEEFVQGIALGEGHHDAAPPT